MIKKANYLHKIWKDIASNNQKLLKRNNGEQKKSSFILKIWWQKFNNYEDEIKKIRREKRHPPKIKGKKKKKKHTRSLVLRYWHNRIFGREKKWKIKWKGGINNEKNKNKKIFKY